MIISNLIYHFFNTYLHFAKLKKCDKKAKKSPIYFFSKQKNVSPIHHSTFFIFPIPSYSFTTRFMRSSPLTIWMMTSE